MKPGDLRWFNASLVPHHGGTVAEFAGCIFMVLEVNYNHALATRWECQIPH